MAMRGILVAVAMLLASAGCHSSMDREHGDWTDADAVADDPIPDEALPTDAGHELLIDVPLDSLSPEEVAELCEEITGDVYWAIYGYRDATQDEFCEGVIDCTISSGDPHPGGVCPNACSCLCYQGMTFVLACTAVDCDLPGTCRP